MKNKITRRSFLGVAGAAGAAMALAACGGGGGEAPAEEGGEEEAGEEAAPEAEPESEAEGTVGGATLTVGSAYGPSSFDPANCSSAFCMSANMNVMEGLYDIDFHTYATGDGICVGDPVWVDDNHAEITLREGAMFSDGTPVTPEDVIYSYTRATDPDGLYIAFHNMITGMEKKDDTTLTVECSIPQFSLLKDRLAIIKVMPQTLDAETAAAWPVGSGPWMYTEVSDTYVVLQPNPNYNGAHPAQDNELRIDSMTDPTARVTAQQEGTTLISESCPPDSIEQLEAAGCIVDQVQGFGTRFIMFNVKKAPWDSKEARQAVMYALNTDNMIVNAFSGLAGKPDCYLPASFANHHTASTVYNYDVDKAKELGGAITGTIELRTTDNAQVVSMGTQAQQDLQDAFGVTVNLTSDQSPATYAAIDQADDSWDILIAPGDPSCFGGDTDLLLNWWFGDNIWMKTRCAWNTSEEWKQVNTLMSDALVKSGDEQQDCWNQVFDILADQCVLYPVLQVITPTAFWMSNPSPAGQRVTNNFAGIGTTGVCLTDVATVNG
ncbi:MAG: ABC transporter substrate-binding protein [Atopobiaceae bacterium]|nr:ABC transporter substrate-binding protein [Atopobiaceae bacterium]